MGSMPSLGTKILQAAWPKKERKKKTPGKHGTTPPSAPLRSEVRLADSLHMSASTGSVLTSWYYLAWVAPHQLASNY